jgi:ABC-type lipoprotein release transport system permease subunit
MKNEIISFKNIHKSYYLGEHEIIVGVWLFLVLISVVSSLLPAIRASKMEIVDALRYN